MQNATYSRLLAAFIWRMEFTLAAHDSDGRLYFAIGNFILDYEKQKGYNKEIVYRLFRDAKKKLSKLKGKSLANPTQMRKVAAAYRDIDGDVPSVALQWLTWHHHLILLKKVKGTPARLFYLQRAYEQQWSRKDMVKWIKAGLYEQENN
jgi:hypothetical protein